MRTPRKNSKKVAAALAPIVFAGGLLAPGATAVAASHSGKADSPAAAQAKVGASKGFDVRNYSSHPVKLTSITGDGDFEGRPNVGEVIQPGGAQHFELRWRFAATEIDHAHYQVLDGNGRQTGEWFDAHMGTDAINHPSAYCVAGGGYDCTPGMDRHSLNPPWNDGATTLTFMNAPGTQVTIPGGQGQAQADVLKQICDNGDGNCTFNVKSEKRTVAKEVPAGAPVYNRSDLPKTGTTITASATVSETNSTGWDITAGVEKIVKVEVTRKFEHSWTTEHTFSQDVRIDEIPPRSMAWITFKAPVIRDTGDFTVTLGNTTWHLTDVSFDTPDPSPPLPDPKDPDKDWGYIINTAPLTQHHLAYADAHPLAVHVLELP